MRLLSASIPLLMLHNQVMESGEDECLDVGEIHITTPTREHVSGHVGSHADDVADGCIALISSNEKVSPSKLFPNSTWILHSNFPQRRLIFCASVEFSGRKSFPASFPLPNSPPPP